MSEPTKENPKTSKRSRRRPAMEPLGWDEIVSQPGMGGYLSFLNGPIPLPHLQGSATELVPNPGVLLGPGLNPGPGHHLVTEIAPDPVVGSVPRLESIPDLILAPDITRSETSPDSMGSPGVVPTPATVATPGTAHATHTSRPGVVSGPGPFQR